MGGLHGARVVHLVGIDVVDAVEVGGTGGGKGGVEAAREGGWSVDEAEMEGGK